MPASEPSEEHDDPGQYANVNGEEDASTNIERGNCHARPHMISTQNTRCALAVPKSWIIDQKVARDVGLRSPGAEFARQGVIKGRATSTGFQGADARRPSSPDALRGGNGKGPNLLYRIASMLRPVC